MDQRSKVDKNITNHQTPNTKHQTPNTKHQTPNTKHQTKKGCYLRFMPCHSPGYLRGEILSELISSKLLHGNNLTWVPDLELCNALLKMEQDQVSFRKEKTKITI